MNRQDIARQLAAKALTHTLTDAASIMIAAELGAELVAILPRLVAEGLCHLAFTSTPESKFLPQGTNTETDDMRWHVTLRVNGVPMNFTGLMTQYGSDDIALQLLLPLLHEVAVPGSRSLGQQTAVRFYFPDGIVRQRFELENFKVTHRYGQHITIPREHRKETDSEKAGRGPVDRWLLPVTDYLRDIVGIHQDEINKVLLDVLGDEKLLQNIEKVVSIVGAYTGGNEALGKTLTAQLSTVLRLHFQDGARQCKHLDYLVSRGMKWSFSDDVQAVLVEEIAKGNLTLALQHVTRYTKSRPLKDGKLLGKDVTTPEGMVLDLLPRAFNEAMYNSRYGIGAALAQIDPPNVAGPEAMMRAIELAIAFGKPIRLNWNRVTTIGD